MFMSGGLKLNEGCKPWNKHGDSVSNVLLKRLNTVIKGSAVRCKCGLIKYRNTRMTVAAHEAGGAS